MKGRKEIERLYPDEWVLVEETGWDETEMPVLGRVLAHNPDRDKLTPEIRQISQRHPGIQLFSFYTGEKIPGDGVPIL